MSRHALYAEANWHAAARSHGVVAVELEDSLKYLALDHAELLKRAIREVLDGTRPASDWYAGRDNYGAEVLFPLASVQSVVVWTPQALADYIADESERHDAVREHRRIFGEEG